MAFSLQNEYYLRIEGLFANHRYLVTDDFKHRIKQSIRVLHYDYLWGSCREAEAICVKSQISNLFELIMSIYNKRRESHQAKFLLLHCFENALRSTMATIVANSFNNTKDDWFLRDSNNEAQRDIKKKAHAIAKQRKLDIRQLNTFEVFDLFTMGDLKDILKTHYYLFEHLFNKPQNYKGQDLHIYGTQEHLIDTIERIRSVRNEIFHNKPNRIRFQKDVEILLLRLGYNLSDAIKVGDIQKHIKLKFIYQNKNKRTKIDKIHALIQELVRKVWKNRNLKE